MYVLSRSCCSSRLNSFFGFPRNQIRFGGLGKGWSFFLFPTWGTQNHPTPCFGYLKTRFFGGENLCFSWFLVPLGVADHGAMRMMTSKHEINL